MTSNEILFLIGAAVFAVTGMLAAARQNMDVMSFIVIGVVTAIGGGVVRDVLVGQPNVLLRRELSMTPTIIGSALYVVVRNNVTLPTLQVSLFGIAVITAVRFGAIRWGWAFPDWLTYRPASK